MKTQLGLHKRNFQTWSEYAKQVPKILPKKFLKRIFYGCCMEHEFSDVHDSAVVVIKDEI